MDDTLSALQRLAANVRDRFRGPVVGITGSVGKTTTRSLTGAKSTTISRRCFHAVARFAGILLFFIHVSEWRVTLT